MGFSLLGGWGESPHQTKMCSFPSPKQIFIVSLQKSIQPNKKIKT